MWTLALAAAAAAFAQQLPAGDTAQGQGHVLETDFSFSSTAGPNGEDLAGTLTTSGYLNFTASLTCGSSSGNAVVGGYRIETGPKAGRGFISAAVDNGPPVNGKPVDRTIYSGYLPRPPRNCPSPGEPPPPGFSSRGGGPFTRGDFTFHNATERLPAGARAARVSIRGLLMRPHNIGAQEVILVINARVCGQPGMSLFRVTQKSSPMRRNRPVDVLSKWHDEVPQTETCETHRIERLLTDFPGGRRYTISLRARTTGTKWSKPVTDHLDS